MAWYLATVAGCYWLHEPLLAAGVLIPAISEMGVSKHGRFMYRTGFGVCGLMLAVTLLLVQRRFRSHDIDETVLYWGLLASLGISLQGLCALRLSLGLETLCHFLGAMITILGAVSHATACNDWFASLPPASPLLKGVGPSIRRQLSSSESHGILLFALPLLLQAGQRLGCFKELNVLENCMGLMPLGRSLRAT